MQEKPESDGEAPGGDILASIRRIVSEEGDRAATDAAAEGDGAAADAREALDDDDVLVLTPSLRVDGGGDAQGGGAPEAAAGGDAPDQVAPDQDAPDQDAPDQDAPVLRLREHAGLRVAADADADDDADDDDDAPAAAPNLASVTPFRLEPKFAIPAPDAADAVAGRGAEPPAPGRDGDDAAPEKPKAGLFDLDAADDARSVAGLTRQELDALISDAIRKELSGSLGDRISANIRRLVQREVQRSIASILNARP